MGKLVIDGNSVYEIDEDCIRRKEDRDSRQKEKKEGYDRERYDHRNPHRKP